MTHNKAIETLKYIKTFDGMNYGATKIALDMAIEAVDENAAYKELGTISEIIEQQYELQAYKTLGEFEDVRFILDNIGSIKLLKEIQDVMKVYENTFTYSRNDYTHSIFARAVYGLVTGKKEYLEEYNELLDEFSKQNQDTEEQAEFTFLAKRDAEVREETIDEFVKEIEAEYDNDSCPNVSDYLDYKISIRDLFRIAESLKEYQDKDFENEDIELE